MNWMDKHWQYKDYDLKIDHDFEGDVVKAIHLYTYDGKTRVASITPYDSDGRTFELFVDCIEAGADPKGPFVKSLNGRAMYTSWDKKSLQDYAIKFIVNGRSKY